MTTYCQCDVCLEIAAEVSLSDAVEALQIVQQLKDDVVVKRTLEEVNHFHNFGRDRVCACGMREVHYIYRQRDNDETLICPLVKARPVETAAEFAERLNGKRSRNKDDRSDWMPDENGDYGKVYRVLVSPADQQNLVYLEKDIGDLSFDTAVKLYERGEEFEK